MKNSLIFIICSFIFPMLGLAQFEVSKDTIVFEKQTKWFVLGLEEIKIDINKVVYDVSDKEFVVTGFVDNYKNDSDIGMVDIDLIRENKTFKKYYFTQRYGYFKVKMKLKHKLTFYGGVYEGYLSIKKPLKNYYKPKVGK